jgi:hypothetical protein
MLCRIRKEVGMDVGGEGQRQAVWFVSHAASESTEGQKTYSQEAKEAWRWTEGAGSFGCRV